MGFFCIPRARKASYAPITSIDAQLTQTVYEDETEEEVEQRKAEYEQRRKEHEAEQQRREEERKAEFEKQQKQYEAKQKRHEKLTKARTVIFERISAES